MDLTGALDDPCCNLCENEQIVADLVANVIWPLRWLASKIVPWLAGVTSHP